MEDALCETTVLRQVSELSLECIPNETIILNFRRLLEKYELAVGPFATGRKSWLFSDILKGAT